MGWCNRDCYIKQHSIEQPGYDHKGDALIFTSLFTRLFEKKKYVEAAKSNSLAMLHFNRVFFGICPIQNNEVIIGEKTPSTWKYCKKPGGPLLRKMASPIELIKRWTTRRDKRHSDDWSACHAAVTVSHRLLRSTTYISWWVWVNVFGSFGWRVSYMARSNCVCMAWSGHVWTARLI